MTRRRRNRAPSPFAAAGLDPAPIPEFMPDFSLDNWITRRRREMGEARWQQLNREWEA